MGKGGALKLFLQAAQGFTQNRSVEGKWEAREK